ncbi:MAG TPA: DUF1320 family protein [Myxococcota bacterium]|jgi:phage gp36-like protein|nr:DUF1320 family protein [Myxococcota bacterium]
MAYCTAENIQTIFGSHNVRVWADLNANNDEAEIEARIAHAIEIATAEVDSILAGTPYKVPMTNPPALITEITATLAGVYLYEGRGGQAIDPQSNTLAHPYMFKRMWALSILKELRTGTRRLSELS